MEPTMPIWKSHKVFSAPAPRKARNRDTATATHRDVPKRTSNRYIRTVTPRWAAITGRAYGRYCRSPATAKTARKSRMGIVDQCSLWGKNKPRSAPGTVPRLRRKSQSSPKNHS